MPSNDPFTSVTYHNAKLIEEKGLKGQPEEIGIALLHDRSVSDSDFSYRVISRLLDIYRTNARAFENFPILNSFGGEDSMLNLDAPSKRIVDFVVQAVDVRPALMQDAGFIYQLRETACYQHPAEYHQRLVELLPVDQRPTPKAPARGNHRLPDLTRLIESMTFK